MHDFDSELADDLVHQIGTTILNNARIKSEPWDALSFASTITTGGRQMNGYRYEGDDWEATLPKGDIELIMDMLSDLQDAMAAATGKRWKQALIHITRPGPEIDVQFEYDDPTRWSLKKVSLDLADYAESLRPPRR